MEEEKEEDEEGGGRRERNEEKEMEEWRIRRRIRRTFIFFPSTLILSKKLKTPCH